MNKDLKKGSGVKSEISPADGKPLVIGSAVTVNKLIEVLERDYGWSFHDEEGKLHITDMQREYMIDVAKATKDILLG